MAKEKPIKTNVTRILQSKGIAHTIRTYATEDGAIDGVSVAQKVGVPVEQVFKTLVTQGHSGAFFVYVIPVAATLDLKAAAAAAGEKNIHMLPQKDLLPLTGYIHGGCSPIGMKKAFPTFLDASAQGQSIICVSAGKVGVQVALPPQTLLDLTHGQLVPLAGLEG